jgi:hypothetical protein
VINSLCKYLPKECCQRKRCRYLPHDQIVHDNDERLVLGSLDVYLNTRSLLINPDRLAVVDEVTGAGSPTFVVVGLVVEAVTGASNPTFVVVGLVVDKVTCAGNPTLVAIGLIVDTVTGAGNPTFIGVGLIVDAVTGAVNPTFVAIGLVVGDILL